MDKMYREVVEVEWLNGKNKDTYTPTIQISSPDGDAMFIKCRNLCSVVTYYIDHSISRPSSHGNT